MQANQTRRHGNGCSGARLPLSIWRKVQPGDNITLNDFGFAETERVNMQMGPNTTCSDFVDLYFTKEFWELLVTEANCFAVQFFENHELTSYTSEWVPVTIDEMKVFIGLVMLMSIIHGPSINLYWTTDALYHMPTFSQVMNRNQFNLILKFLHFNNDEYPTFDQNDDKRDHLHKVRPLINIFHDCAKLVYLPAKNLSVDESLVLFKGCLQFKQ